MISLYKFEKQAKSEHLKSKQEKEWEEWLKAKSEEKEEMIENYQRRVHEFIKKTREKQLSKEKEFSAILQKSFRKPCLGDESMRKVHKRQKERREEAVEGNRLLEVVAHPYSWQPGWEPLQLRPRDKSQEVVAPFRQRPRGSIERIYDQTLDKGINNNID